MASFLRHVHFPLPRRALRVTVSRLFTPRFVRFSIFFSIFLADVRKPPEPRNTRSRIIHQSSEHQSSIVGTVLNVIPRQIAVIPLRRRQRRAGVDSWKSRCIRIAEASVRQKQTTTRTNRRPADDARFSRRNAMASKRT